jgi:hypothetical protein
MNPCSYLSSRLKTLGLCCRRLLQRRDSQHYGSYGITGRPPPADTTPYSTRWLPTFTFHLAKTLWYVCYNVSVLRSLLHCHRFPSRGSATVFKNTCVGCVRLASVVNSRMGDVQLTWLAVWLPLRPGCQIRPDFGTERFTMIQASLCTCSVRANERSPHAAAALA